MKEKICENCKYHEIDEIVFDNPQSICIKRKTVIEKWFKCDEFEDKENERIKEILDELKDEDIYIEDYDYQYKRISLKETKQLLDYITNLQQENERLNKALQDIKDFIDKHTKINKETNTKYLLTNVKDDNILIDIVNKALGGINNGKI